MRKPLLTLLILFSTYCFASGQTWTIVGQPFNENEGCGCTYTMNSLAVYNKKLYVGGSVANAIATGIGSWDGAKWDTLGSGFNNTAFTSANAMVVFNGDLYVGGKFATIGMINSANSIAKWNDTTWSAVGSGVSGDIYAIASFNGELYVGGVFDSAGGIPVNNIAKWNGTSWSAIGDGVSSNAYSVGGQYYSVNTMTVYNGNLYVGGYFDSAGGKVAHNIAVWNGSNWSTVGSGIANVTRGDTVFSGGFTITTSWNYCVKTLCVFNNELYAGGTFDSAGNYPANNVAAWNGIVWSNVGIGLGGDSKSLEYSVNSLYAINNILYAGGAFDSSGNVPLNSIAKWNGLSWSAMGSGVIDNPFQSSSGYSLPCVNAVTSYNGYIYIAGLFDSVANVFSGCVAQWTGTVGVNELSSNNSFTVYPNPSNGIFNVELNGNNEKTSLEIYNMLGEKVYPKEFSIINSQFSINLSNQPAGIYLYRVISENGDAIGSGKLVIQ